MPHLHKALLNASNSKMTPYDFLNNWTYTDEPLSPLTKTMFDRFNLQSILHMNIPLTDHSFKISQ